MIYPKIYKSIFIRQTKPFTSILKKQHSSPRRWSSKVGSSSNGRKSTSISHFSGNLRSLSFSDNFGNSDQNSTGDCLFQCKDIAIPVFGFPYPPKFKNFANWLKNLFGCWEIRGISLRKKKSYFLGNQTLLKVIW